MPTFIENANLAYAPDVDQAVKYLKDQGYDPYFLVDKNGKDIDKSISDIYVLPKNSPEPKDNMDLIKRAGPAGKVNPHTSIPGGINALGTTAGAVIGTPADAVSLAGGTIGGAALGGAGSELLNKYISNQLGYDLNPVKTAVDVAGQTALGAVSPIIGAGVNKVLSGAGGALKNIAQTIAPETTSNITTGISNFAGRTLPKAIDQALTKAGVKLGMMDPSSLEANSRLGFLLGKNPPVLGTQKLTNALSEALSDYSENNPGKIMAAKAGLTGQPASKLAISELINFLRPTQQPLTTTAK